MAKRNDAGSTSKTTSEANAPDAVEQRIVAFAEQLGRIVGTVQAKAEGWMDRETLTSQITSVRDSAVELLEEITGRGAKTPSATSSQKKTVRGMTNKGRSGGVVDAPGKKHRPPAPADPGARLAKSKAATMRISTTVKTSRGRGRGG